MNIPETAFFISLRRITNSSSYDKQYMCILLVNHRGILLTALNIRNVVSALTIEERVVLTEERLWEFRDSFRPFETRNSLTTSWNIVPYPVNPVNWFIFNNLLHNFLDDIITALF